jgi:hypothetical protein
MKRAQEEHARSQAQSLGTSAQAYQARYGELPQALADLAEGDQPVVEPRMLLDPWGRPFQYDPTGPRNGGARPDVWSLGPPDQEGALIGNWPEGN